MQETLLFGFVAILVASACSGDDGASGAGQSGGSSGGGGQGGASSSSSSASAGQGGAAACQVDVDCPAGFCLLPQCAAGVCGTAPAPAGTPCPEGACDASGACVEPCADGVKDGDETDVDCGGATCGAMLGKRCDLGEACLVHDDCFTGKCCTPAPGILGECISAADACAFM